LLRLQRQALSTSGFRHHTRSRHYCPHRKLAGFEHLVVGATFQTFVKKSFVGKCHHLNCLFEKSGGRVYNQASCRRVGWVTTKIPSPSVRAQKKQGKFKHSRAPLAGDTATPPRSQSRQATAATVPLRHRPPQSPTPPPPRVRTPPGSVRCHARTAGAFQLSTNSDRVIQTFGGGGVNPLELNHNGHISSLQKNNDDEMVLKESLLFCALLPFFYLLRLHQQTPPPHLLQGNLDRERKLPRCHPDVRLRCSGAIRTG
jgi:hypothetical protein